MSLLFNGAYANPDTPLWLSAITPIPAPANLQVSTMTVSPSGGAIMANNNANYPNNVGAPISFNRQSGSPLPPTELQMRSTRAGATNDSILSVTTNGGTVYDNLAVKGIYVFGNQVTNPNANSGAAGYITGPRSAAPPYSVRINTGYLDIDRISSFIINSDIVEVNDDLYAKNAVFSTLTVSTGTAIGNNPVFSTVTAQYGNFSQNVTALGLNANSYTGPYVNTQSIFASTVTTQILNTSTINVSSFTLPNAFSVSSLTASTVNTSVMTASTLAVSSFTLPNVLTFSTINASSINCGVISSLVGNFSSIISPGGSTNIPVVSSIITVAKELITSTMTFTTTLSPKLDLGLGGIVGGLVGGVTANAMGVGLGAAGLATGATALILARQSGGLNPGQFQTVNGTTQLQFSTITVANPGIPIYGKFLGTDSVDPLHTPGNLVTSSNFQGYGQSYVVRSVSDPLNLPNADGAAGKAIQSFGEWVKVMPGRMDMGISTIFNQYNTNYVDFGNTSGSVNPPVITLGNGNYDASAGAQPLIQVKGQLDIDNGGITALQFTGRDSAVAPYGYFSSIIASYTGTRLSTIGIYPGIITSTLAVSSLMVNVNTVNRLSVTNDLTVGTNVTLGNLLTVSGAAFVGTNLTVTNNANITNNVTTSNINLQKINGVAYNPVTAGTPPGALMMWPGGSALAGPTNVPAGYLYCDGSEYSGGTYPNLYAAIGNTWGGTPGVSFRVPDTRGRSAFGSLVDITSGSAYAYQAQVNFTSVTVSGTGTAGSTNNGWYVTATTQQVYVGMTFNFAGAVGLRSITKILGRNGLGNGWVTPFTIVWSSPAATTFPVFTDSVANVGAESDSTVGPFIGRIPAQPGSGFNVQMQLGSAGITQAIDQTSPHLHTYNLGNGKSYNVEGAPDLIAANNGRDTSEPQGLYQFTPPGGAGGSGTNTMNNLPPNFAIFYYIKT